MIEEFNPPCEGVGGCSLGHEYRYEIHADGTSPWPPSQGGDIAETIKKNYYICTYFTPPT